MTVSNNMPVFIYFYRYLFFSYSIYQIFWSQSMKAKTVVYKSRWNGPFYPLMMKLRVCYVQDKIYSNRWTLTMAKLVNKKSKKLDSLFWTLRIDYFQWSNTNSCCHALVGLHLWLRVDNGTSFICCLCVVSFFITWS